MSMRGITSASMTRSVDFVRSWLRSSRTVSRLVSTSSLPPATNPATSTRWKGETSIFGRIGVSIGISKYDGPQATARAARSAHRLTKARLLARRVFAGAGGGIDFLEQFEVLANLQIVRLEFSRLLVRLARLIELAFVFVSDSEVVEGGRIRRVDLDGLFPPVNGFAPEAALRDVDAECDLRLGVVTRVGDRRRCRQEQRCRTCGDTDNHG